jgi:hypothetical protein
MIDEAVLTELGKEVTRTLLVINEIELGVEESDTGTG